jgi:membrane protein
MSKTQARDSARQESISDLVSADGLRRVWTVIKQSVKDLFTDSGPQWAAAIAYYSLLSVFPLLLAAVAIAAFFVDPQWAIGEITRLLQKFVPQGAVQIESIVRGVFAARGGIGALSLVTLLWTGSRVFGVTILALNIAYDADETYGFWKRTLVELVMMATIGVLLIVALAVRPLLALLSNTLGVLPASPGILLQAAQIALPALLLLAVFFLIYRFVPRTQQSWRPALAGAVVATLLFLAARPLFFYYVRRFGNYNLIYGSVAIVVILTLWAWVMALIMLFGGELASHIQALLVEGKPAHEVERSHQARSPRRRKT